MGNKHFSLLIETLELEEELSNTSLIDFSLNNIEKDNINKIWTFNFSGKNLPNSETLTLFIQKLRDSFSDEYIINYRFKLEDSVSEDQIKEYWKYVILENFSEVSPGLLQSLIFTELT